MKRSDCNTPSLYLLVCRGVLVQRKKTLSKISRDKGKSIQKYLREVPKKVKHAHAQNEIVQSIISWKWLNTSLILFAIVSSGTYLIPTFSTDSFKFFTKVLLLLIALNPSPLSLVQWFGCLIFSNQEQLVWY